MFWIAEIILYDFNIIVVNTNLCDLLNYKKKKQIVFIIQRYIKFIIIAYCRST